MLTVVGVLIIGSMLLTLKTVHAAENALEVRGYFRRITVPYTEILEVKAHWPRGRTLWYVTVPLVRVILKSPTVMGKRIRFLGRAFEKGFGDGVHPDVLFLRDKIAQSNKGSEKQMSRVGGT